MKQTIGRAKGRCQIKIFNGLNYISAQMFWDFVNFLAVLDKTGTWNRLILRSLRTRASMANNSVCSLLSTLRCIYMLSWRVDLVPLKTINTSSQATYELLRRNESSSLEVFSRQRLCDKKFFFPFKLVRLFVTITFSKKKSSRTPYISPLFKSWFYM